MTPTGTRRRLSAAERREQIMTATVSVVAELGYQSASVDAIARAAGVSKGLLWHYFGSQDELLADTARRALLTLRHAVGAVVDLDAPAPEIVRAAIHGATGLRLSHGAELRTVREIALNLRAPDGSPVLTSGDYEDTYAAQEAIFRRGQEAGDFRADLDPRLLAVTYQGAVDSMLAHLDRHPELDAGRYADLVADVLLGGMCRGRTSAGVSPTGGPA